jgi:hypothetical protein
VKAISMPSSARSAASPGRVAAADNHHRVADTALGLDLGGGVIHAGALEPGRDHHRPGENSGPVIEGDHIVPIDDLQTGGLRRSWCCPTPTRTDLCGHTSARWEELRAAVATQLGGSRCRVGVGRRCVRPTDFRRSYREAGLALRLQAGVGRNGSIDRAISFDDLGVLRLLLTIDDTAAIERFAHEWLGALLDYDAKRGSEMVWQVLEALRAAPS